MGVAISDRKGSKIFTFAAILKFIELINVIEIDPLVGLVEYIAKVLK